MAAAQPRDGALPVRVSLPENGEYANETYFVTGEGWQDHLHLLPLGEPKQMIALMSDGAAPFVMERGFAGFFRPFMDPVENYLASASIEAGSRALAGLLDDPRTHAITPDDKTLLIARRR